MKNYKIESTDIPYLDKFYEAQHRGLFVDGKTATDIYNKVFNANLKATSCQTCIRQRVRELTEAYNDFKTKLKNEEEKTVEVQQVKKVGRPKKNP